MNLKIIIIQFIAVFTIALIVSIGVTCLWNFVFHGEAIIELESSFRLAIILGIILPVVESRKKNEN